MRLYLAEDFRDRFNSKRKVDVEASFRMEQIGFMLVYDSMPGEIRIEFSLAECNHIAEIYSIFRRLEADRNANRPAILTTIEPEPIQKQFRFWDSGQYELFKLAA